MKWPKTIPKTTDMKKMPKLNYESFLADAMRDYLDYLDALGFSTAMPVYYLRRIDRFLVEHHIRHFEQLNTQLMIQFADQYKGQVRAQTLRLWKHTFYGLCRYLIRLGWMTKNPVAGLPVPKAQPYHPHVFSPRELHLFFDFLTGHMKQASNPADKGISKSQGSVKLIEKFCRVPPISAFRERTWPRPNKLLWVMFAIRMN